MDMNTTGLTIYCSFIAYLVFINWLTYFLFRRDKHNARHKKERISERCLLLCSWLGGALGARIAMKRLHHKTNHWRFHFFVPLAILLWIFPFSSITAVFIMRSGPVFTTAFMFHQQWKYGESVLDDSIQHKWVDYEQISPQMVRAVIASEDNLFQKHHGFSQRGIRQAWKEYKQGQVKHGGSTISQQTAKNVFTTGKRTWWRKARETWYTVLIETFWGKKRIMEVYLNVIEMGRGIYGAETAAQCYFRHSAKSLSASEAALITAALPNPRVYSVIHPGPYMQRRQKQILNLMPKMGPINLE